MTCEGREFESPFAHFFFFFFFSSLLLMSLHLLISWLWIFSFVYCFGLWRVHSCPASTLSLYTPRYLLNTMRLQLAKFKTHQPDPLISLTAQAPWRRGSQCASDSPAEPLFAGFVLARVWAPAAPVLIGISSSQLRPGTCRRVVPA